jgi:hypothetical protein
VVAVTISVWRAREAKRVTTYGSALGMAICNSEAEPFWVEFLRG